MKYERETKELENKKIQLQKKTNNLEIMKYIMNYHKKETQEKLQFYQNNIIKPLELKQVSVVQIIKRNVTIFIQSTTQEDGIIIQHVAQAKFALHNWNLFFLNY